MKRLSAITACVLFITGLLTGMQQAHANGVWGQCVASDSGKTYVISNGGFSADLCFKLARQCTGNPDVKASHFSSNRLITGSPLIICKQIYRATSAATESESSEGILFEDRKRVGRELERAHRSTHKEVKRFGQKVFGW